MLTLEKEIGYLVGVPVDYYAAIDLAGFAKMIDAIGGVDVYNPRAIHDPTTATYVPAGPVHLDGTDAMKYVRSRENGGSDYLRASRQQAVLVAAERKVASPGRPAASGRGAVAGGARPSRPTSRSVRPASTSPPRPAPASRCACLGRPTATIRTPPRPAGHGPAASTWPAWRTCPWSCSARTAATTGSPEWCRPPAASSGPAGSQRGPAGRAVGPRRGPGGLLADYL